MRFGAVPSVFWKTMPLVKVIGPLRVARSVSPRPFREMMVAAFAVMEGLTPFLGDATDEVGGAGAVSLIPSSAIRARLVGPPAVEIEAGVPRMARLPNRNAPMLPMVPNCVSKPTCWSNA